MWGVNLLFSPAGKVVLAVLAFAAWTAYQRADAVAGCREEQVRQQLEQANRMLEESARIAAEASQKAALTQQELERLEADRDAILAELQQAGAACPIPDSLRERLRAIQ